MFTKQSVPTIDYIYISQDSSTKYGVTSTATDHYDEGYVQLNTVPTLSLTLYDTVYVTVWAVNGVRFHFSKDNFILYQLSLFIYRETYWWHNG